MLKAFKQKLEERRLTVAKEFDDSLEAKLKEAAQQRLVRAKEEKTQTRGPHRADPQRAEGTGSHDSDHGQQATWTSRIFERSLAMDEELLGQVNRRLQTFEMERERKPRVELASLAEMKGLEDKRFKFAGMTVFGALVCGFGLAFLRDRMDKTLQTPADVTRQIDLPILGTTTSSRTIKPAQFAEQIAGDYQTIRTNLGLLYNGGMPKKLVISSAGMREGKTTFAVNLATSLAKSGKKVLLIDGDLRKPDIGHMLNVLNNAGGLQNVLMGEDPSNIICVLPTSGLHVLAANPRHHGDAYELLTSSTAAEQMETAGPRVRSSDRGQPADAGLPGCPGVGQAHRRGHPGQLRGTDDGARSQGGQGPVRPHSGTHPGSRPHQRARGSGPVPSFLHVPDREASRRRRKSGKPKKMLLTSPGQEESKDSAEA